jgi:hypothetical protein
MADNMSDDVADMYSKIEKLYANSGYMDKYGTDVWAAVIICVVFLLLTNYYIFANALEVVRADWPNQKCNPLILPFAGFINKPSDQTNLEFTASNFNNCINSMLKQIVELAVQPLYFAVSILQEACSSMIEAFQKLRAMTLTLRTQFSNVIAQLYAGISNLIVAIMSFVVKMKDSMAKVNGILTTALYTIFGSYMAAESLFLCIIDLITIILIIIVVLIVLFWAIAIGLFGIPFVGPGLAAPWGYSAVIYTVVMISILIPVVWFEVVMTKIMGLSVAPPPGVPGCFAEDSIVELFDDNGKPIKDIQLGDVLKNGSTVTAIFKIAAKEQHLYRLNSVLVTGEHRVYHPVLKWIKVKNHPSSIYVPEFNEPYVYCLGTDMKMFTIGSTLFSDWDDIDENVLEDLCDNCVARGYLPSDFTYKDIHIYLDSGFHGDSSIVLNNGLTAYIKDVNVGDILLSGDKVVGIVKIAAHDMIVHSFSFSNGKSIIGSQNIHINDPDLGVINGMNHAKSNLLERPDYIHHLLTDTKCFVINGIRVDDYNSGIDKYLRISI